MFLARVKVIKRVHSLMSGCALTCQRQPCDLRMIGGEDGCAADGADCDAHAAAGESRRFESACLMEAMIPHAATKGRDKREHS